MLSCRDVCVVVVFATMGVGCSSGNGKSGSGGSAGGADSSGGATATGGMTGAGGTMAAGGSAATGGSTASNNTGGLASTGGAQPSGGRSAGGVPGSGGSVPGSGGSSGSGGAIADGGGSANGGSSTAGCGSANATSPCSKSGTTCSLTVSGTSRTFYVQLPSGYSSAKPYPLVFQFHPMGGTAEMALNMYGVSGNFPAAIYVTPQGLTSNGTTGWPNTDGQDVAFTKAMIDYVETNYCVDKSRLFSLGFSYGGMMSITLGCQMPDVFRAIGVESGFSISFPCSPSHPIAVWQTQGDQDTVVTPANASSARDVFVKLNGCASTTQPVDPSPCVAYDGCKDGYPVEWCLVAGEGHAMPSFAGKAIAAFFKQF